MTTPDLSSSDLFSQIAHGTPPNRPALPFWSRLFALPSYHLLLITSYWVLFLHVADIHLALAVFGFVSVSMQFPFVKARISKKWHGLLQKLSVFFVLGILVANFGTLGATDFSINFLVLCFFAKLWEIYGKRDAYVALNLGLFVISATFLWSQGLGKAVQVVLGVLLVLMSFVALSDDEMTGKDRVRALAWTALPAVPLLVILFVFFPRFDPLWQLNFGGSKATTGISDSMSPGDFANLSKSTDLAFRVEFDGQIPHRQELYWRGLVFDKFDGKTWRADDRPQAYWRSFEPLPDWAGVVDGQGDSRYTVMLEPTQQHWLFALDYSRPDKVRGVGMTGDFTLRSYQPIAQNLRYQVEYFPRAKVGLALTDEQKKSALALPDTGNDKARAFAKELSQQARGDTRTLIGLIQNHIGQGEFYYTLSPPVLKDNRIDEFLFDTKQGFCEHYASSFVFLMRSAGVPTRVVTGYQGGQLGRDGKSWEVRQMDAHAWAEVWLDGQGWVRVDPTAFVAPNRILDGMSDFTEGAGAEVFGDGVMGAIGYRQFRLLQSFHRFSDEMGYYWHKNVVGFDANTQKQSLGRFGVLSLTSQILVMMAGFGAVMAMIGAVLWYKRRAVYHLFDKPIYALAKRLAKQDPILAKSPFESCLGYLERLAGAFDETTKADITALAKTYRSHRFGQASKQEGSDDYRQSAKAFAKDVALLNQKIK